MMIKNVASKSNLALNCRTGKLYPNIEVDGLSKYSSLAQQQCKNAKAMKRLTFSQKMPRMVHDDQKNT